MPRRIRDSRKRKRDFSHPAGFPEKDLEHRASGQAWMGRDDSFRQVPVPWRPEEKIGIQPTGPEAAFPPAPESPLGGFQNPEKRPSAQKRPSDETLVPVRGRGVFEWTGAKRARNPQDKKTSVRFERPENPGKNGRGPREISPQTDPEPHQRPEKRASFSIRATASVSRFSSTVRANRTYPSPDFPNPVPGVDTIPALSRRARAASSLDIPFGSPAQM